MLITNCSLTTFTSIQKMSNYMILFLFGLSLLPLVLTESPGCGGIDAHYAVNSSSSLSELVESAEKPLNCSVITIVSRDLSLSGIVTFERLFNLSIIGEEQGTVISCELNSGFRFVDSLLIYMNNLVFSGCSMNDTKQHFYLNAHPYFDIAAVYFYQSQSIKIENCGFEESPGTGLLLYEVTGTVTLEGTTFRDNKPENSSDLSNFTSGGLLICRDSRKGKATYTIKNCHFERNRNVIRDFGGALTIHFDAAESVSFVNITASTFVENTAVCGAGLYLNQASASTNAIGISNTSFISNTADEQGGGIFITALSEVQPSPLVLDLYACIFTLNFAMWGGGLSSYVASNKTHIEITAIGSNWTRNGANTSGFAVGLKEHSISGTFSIEATLVDCWIYNNTLRDFENVSGSASGALFASGSKVILRGNMEITNNYRSAVYLLESANVTLDEGYLVFSGNKAARGAAISLKSGSLLHLASSEATIFFSYNSAIIEGGAIYAELTETDPCVFDYLTGASSQQLFVNVNVWFVDNYADNYNQRGQSVFIKGNKARNCFKKSNNNSVITPLQDSPFHYEPNGSNSVLFNAEHVSVNTAPPLDAASKTLTVMLGQRFSLIPTTVDELNHTTTGVAHVALQYDDTDMDPSDRKFTYIGPNLMGLDDYTRNSELYLKAGANMTYDMVIASFKYNLTLAIFFEKNEAGYRDGYAEVSIKLVPCRMGFVYKPNKEMCECFSSSDQVLCPDTSSACIRNGYWFGRVGGNMSTNFLCDKEWCDYRNQRCPTEQCSTSPDFCELHDDSNDLCFPGRGGTLCSHCRENYAFTFTALKCVPDDTCGAEKTVLVVLVVFVYWLLIILLFFILLSMDLSIGTGFASGIVYYFSVVFLLTNSLVTSPFLRMVLNIGAAVTQLDAKLFGEIPVCFAKSWTQNIHHHAFSYASPIFVGFTIFAIIWFSRRCKCPKRISLAENSPNHAICLLILVSYTSMTYTSFQILRPIKIGSGTFVYSDPDIPYFHPIKHLPFAVVAIFIEVFVSLPICFLLLLAPCLSRSKRVNLVKLRLKPIVDEFQACYKDEHRWFAGFYFLARQMMYLAYIIPQQVLPQSNSLLHYVCVLVLLVQTTVRPYKTQFWYLNIIDTFLLTDILLLALFPINSYLNNASSLPLLVRKLQMVSPYFLILLPSLYITGVITFLILKRLYRWFRKSHDRDSETDIAADAESTVNDSEPEFHKRIGSVSFFKDYGEREPLLSETSGTYSTMATDKHLSEQKGFTTSSLRVGNMERFPPAQNCLPATS